MNLSIIEQQQTAQLSNSVNKTDVSDDSQNVANTMALASMVVKGKEEANKILENVEKTQSANNAVSTDDTNYYGFSKDVYEHFISEGYTDKQIKAFSDTFLSTFVKQGDTDAQIESCGDSYFTVQAGLKKDSDPSDWDVTLHSYDLLVLKVLNTNGIQKTTDILKKIAELQEAEDDIHSNLLEITQLLQELQQAPLQYPDAKPGDAGYGQIADSFWTSDKGKTFLSDFKKDWNSIFSEDGNGLSAMDKWRQALIDNGIKPDDYPAYTNIQALGKAFDSGSFGSIDGASIKDWLDTSKPVSVDDTTAKNLFSQAFQQTWLYNNSTTGKSSGNNYIGNATSANSTTTQLIAGLSNSNSTQISLETQVYTSYVNVGQQMIQSADGGKDTFTRNQKTQ